MRHVFCYLAMPAVKVRKIFYVTGTSADAVTTP